MSDEQRLAELRSLFLSAPESSSARIVALLASFFLAVVVLNLVRRRTLRAEYTPIWMGVALAMCIVSFNLDVLRGVARLLGAWTISSTVFFLGEIFLVAICLNYAIRLSQAGAQLRALAQELALLRRAIDDLRAARPDRVGSLAGQTPPRIGDAFADE
ncbi:MAG TPA: DUF2304 domain-containing protein [Myxococcota bacterium]|nr:DUF2304 domain-containing protein [Myxococcota bacterium]